MFKSTSFLLILGFLLVGSVALIMPTTSPPGPMDPYLNGVFPASTPGAAGSWELEDPFPEISIASPLRILDFPGVEDFMVLNKLGEIWGIIENTQSKRLLLDIKDRAFKKGESGCVGMALHPKFGNASFPDKQEIYVFYRHKPDPDTWSDKGFNRVSKFKWNDQVSAFDKNSEEILIQQYDRSTWHNGGAMFFDKDGYLFISFGDEGAEEFQTVSTQRLDGGLFSGIIRIDVDNDPSRSHPIRRQPVSFGSPPPSDWGETFTQGYSIPDDNPWIDEQGNILEEFYAIGVRSPFSVTYDSEKNEIWLADVGSAVEEEISLVEKADNLQWPYVEGKVQSAVHEKPANYTGNEKPAFFSYDRSVGFCIIGGGIYRGTKFPYLNEKYLFADFANGKLMALTNNGSFEEPTKEILIGNLAGQDVTFPEEPGITGIHVQKNGDIYLTIIGDNYFESARIFRLKRKTLVADPPLLLSELGVFSDLENLIPIEGLLPYNVNVPLWSDRAKKQRWIALPNDGSFDSSNEKINFNSTSEWTFQEGTVFVKHFGLPLSEAEDAEIRPLETRFFIIGKGNDNYGLTYKWNAAGTDAVLLGGGSSETYLVEDKFGETYSQTWDYPGRDQCLSCHNENAKHVLGVNTHQLNGSFYYPEIQQELNQLEFFNHLGVFQRDIGAATQYLKSYHIEDASVALEKRIRSYLAANCGPCHQSGVVPMVDLNLKFNLPLHLTNMVNAPTQSQASKVGRSIVLPGDHSSSELWIRDASISNSRMPPIGRHLLDQTYIDSLAKWIDELPMDAGNFAGVLIYPNPSNGLLSIVVGDSFIPPFTILITSISGNIVEMYPSEQQGLNLDLRHLPAGIYLMEIKEGNKKHQEKFILH